MKIKRIFATDMRQAMVKVRDEFGPDAVILSSKKVQGGVEVITALDYDEKAVEAALAREATPPPRSYPPIEPRAASRVASESRQPERQRIDIRVDDELDGDDLSFQVSYDEPDQRPGAARDRAEKVNFDEAPPRASDPSARIEWSQDPALQAMRDELKTLRSLFNNQLNIMGWNRQNQQEPVRIEMLKRLANLGLGNDVARKIADHLCEESDPEKAWQLAQRVLAHHLPVAQEDDIIDEGGVVAIVGPTGVGKTTTVAKLAARYALRHGRQHVALITTDNFRIGAQDQLRNFARILDVPVKTVKNQEELSEALNAFHDKRLVLIDTAGMSQRDMRINAQLQALSDERFHIRPYLVLSATTQLATTVEVVRAFRIASPVGCIVTKLDEATSLGGVMTVALRYRLPLAYLGVGQRVPEDLKRARAENLVEKAAQLSERFSEHMDEEMLALNFGGSSHVG